LIFVFVDTEISSAGFEEFSVSTVDTDDVRELKVLYNLNWKSFNSKREGGRKII